MKYTKEEEIIHFVYLAFLGMKRKKENIDLSFHSIMVGNMLKNIGCTDETVFIGYLHDIIEDTKYDYDYLKNKYGSSIADGVLMLSEDKGISDYHQRKDEFIKRIANANPNIICIELADKLQNLVSDYSLYLEKGKESLVTEAANFEELKWFYTSLQEVFNRKLEKNDLLDRYNIIVDEYFN